MKTDGSGNLGFVSINTPGAAASFTQVDITAEGDLRLQDASGGQYVALEAPATISSSYTLEMPAADGSNGQALITNGRVFYLSSVESRYFRHNIKYTFSVRGQYVSNSSSTLTHTLPSGSAGDTIIISNAGSATVTVGRNSQNIDSLAEDGTLGAGSSVQLVYVDSTIGWHSL